MDTNNDRHVRSLFLTALDNFLMDFSLVVDSLQRYGNEEERLFSDACALESEMKRLRRRHAFTRDLAYEYLRSHPGLVDYVVGRAGIFFLVDAHSVSDLSSYAGQLVLAEQRDECRRRGRGLDIHWRYRFHRSDYPGVEPVVCLSEGTPSTDGLVVLSGN